MTGLFAFALVLNLHHFCICHSVAEAHQLAWSTARTRRAKQRAWSPLQIAFDCQIDDHDDGQDDDHDGACSASQIAPLLHVKPSMQVGDVPQTGYSAQNSLLSPPSLSS